MSYVLYIIGNVLLWKISEKRPKTSDHTKRDNSNALAHGSDYSSSYGDIIASGVTEREAVWGEMVGQ